MSEVKKVNPAKLKGFDAEKHRPYTDYDSEIAQWLEVNTESADFTYLDTNQFIFTSGSGEFYTHTYKVDSDIYYTKEQFKEWIGMVDDQKMTKQEENKDMKLSDLVSGKHVVEYRGGGLRLVLDVGWIGVDACRSDGNSSYTPTMESTHVSYLDIIKVYELNSIGLFNSSLLAKSNLKLVWERVESTPEQVEAEAIRKEMEKLTERLKKLEGK